MNYVINVNNVRVLLSTRYCVPVCVCVCVIVYAI